MHAFFDAFLKTGENCKSCIIQEIDIPEINVQVFENFQNLIYIYHFRFDTVASQKYLGSLQVEQLLGNMAAQK